MAEIFEETLTIKISQLVRSDNSNCAKTLITNDVKEEIISLLEETFKKWYKLPIVIEVDST